MNHLIIFGALIIAGLVPTGWAITTYWVIPNQIPALQDFICNNPHPIDPNQCQTVKSTEWVNGQKNEDYFLLMVGVPGIFLNALVMMIRIFDDKKDNEQQNRKNVPD